MTTKSTGQCVLAFIFLTLFLTFAHQIPYNILVEDYIKSMSSKKEEKDSVISSEKKRKSPPPSSNNDEDDANSSWDLVWPFRNGVLGNAGESLTVVLQIDPEDKGVDLEGSSGVIGRLEVDSNGGKKQLQSEVWRVFLLGMVLLLTMMVPSLCTVILDMRGRQYHGRIYPGPTALILETPAAPVGKQQPNEENESSSSLQQLKVIGVTDEFVRCEEQQGDIMQRLSATYEQGGVEEDGVNETVKKTTVSSAKSTASARKKAKTTTASNA